MEDASKKMSEVHSRHLVSKCLEIFKVNWAKFQAEHEKICHMAVKDFRMSLI